MDAIRIQAKFVLTSGNSLLHPGQVVICGGKIVDVSPVNADQRNLDLGDVVLMPGLINSHTHLEFSDLAKPFPAGDSFPEWIGRVVSHRRNTESQLDKEQLVAKYRGAIMKGLVESFGTGTHVVADIVTYPWQICDLTTPQQLLESATFGEQPDLARAPSITLDLWNAHLRDVSFPRTIALPELIGLSTDRFQSTVTWAEQFWNQKDIFPETLLGIGVSPHAPYSIPKRELESTSHNIPNSLLTAMHIAESEDELQWLEQGNGAFHESFQRLGLPIPETRFTIRESIQLLSTQDRALLVHGNFLTAQDVSLLAQSNSVSVVYCPRTHRHFGHKPYPLDLLMRNNIRIVLATDSRASNPDLHLWREVLQARESHSHLSPQDAFSFVTQNAAQALGIERTHGSIEPGKAACLNVIPCESHWTTANLMDEITSTEIDFIPLATFLSCRSGV